MQSKRNDVMAIQILHKALLTGLALFAVIITFLVESDIIDAGQSEMARVLLIAVSVLALMGVMTGFTLFNKRINEIQPEDDLSAKLEKYRAALILQLALCEGPGLFAVMAYFLTGDRIFLGIVILLIGFFIFLYPSKDKIARQLNLDSQERAMLD